jgi:putative ABC transport system substrate-binding protein
MSWGLAARAQPATTPVVGVLSSLSSSDTAKRVASVVQGMADAGFIAGRQVVVEERIASGRYDALPPLAAELVNRRVNVIVALAPPAAFAAKALTATIPIVFIGAFDPVKAGLVPNLNRPGGSITGVTFLSASLGAKRLELARELVPGANVIGLIINPRNVDGLEELRDAQTAATALGVQLRVSEVSDRGELVRAFDGFKRDPLKVVLISPDPFLQQEREAIEAFAAQNRLPMITSFEESVRANGLISYGADRSEAARVLGTYVGRILKGAVPGDLPVVQPTKVSLIINLRTAKAIGLTIPPTVLARADEVIE